MSTDFFIENKKLLSILEKTDFFTQEQLQVFYQEANDKKRKLWDILLERGKITDEQLGLLVATENHWKYVRLEREQIDEVVIKSVPFLIAREQGIIPFKKEGSKVKIAMQNPENFELIRHFERKLESEADVYYATEKDIAGTLKYALEDPQTTFDNFFSSLPKTKKESDQVSVTEFVDRMVEYAYVNGASDIHFQILENAGNLRFRIDGVLYNAVKYPKTLHDFFIFRIKILAKLRTDEHFLPQDGSFTKNLENKFFDIRVSIVPSIFGENVALRILASEMGRLSLDDLGFGKREYALVEKAIKKSYGMVLAGGPTGSGKTTTMYAILHRLNSPQVNIITIEDPVEYIIEGINQIQVNSQTGLSFSQGLRSIVRQDPDIVLVGEIRDADTANIAVNAALTGHLVLSTIHINTAATSIPRLLDFGVEPFLIASAVEIVIGQRLVRKICLKCRQSKTIGKKDFAGIMAAEQMKLLFGKNKTAEVYEGKGCKVCNQTGYFGRVGIFEIMEISESVKKLILQKADAESIQAAAIKDGMATMIEDGMRKVKEGITTLDEVLAAIS